MGESIEPECRLGVRSGCGWQRPVCPHLGKSRSFQFLFRNPSTACPKLGVKQTKISARLTSGSCQHATSAVRSADQPLRDVDGLHSEVLRTALRRPRMAALPRRGDGRIRNDEVGGQHVGQNFWHRRPSETKPVLDVCELGIRRSWHSASPCSPSPCTPNPSPTTCWSSGNHVHKRRDIVLIPNGNLVFSGQIIKLPPDYIE